MKTILFCILILGSTSIMASNHNCTFDNDGEDGTVNISINGAVAELKLYNNGNKQDHKKCKVSKDEFGQLIDCSALETDLMVIVNEDSGGIMSSTMDLYVDLDC